MVKSLNSSASAPAERIAATPLIVRVCLLSIAGILIAWPWVMTLCFPLTWLGMVIAFTQTRGLNAQQSFGCWLLTGVVAMSTAFHWLPEVASRQLQVGWMNGYVVALISVAWDSFRFGIFGWFLPRIPARHWSRSFWAAALWVMLEWLWPHVFPWRLGHTQIEWLSLCQISELTGVYGLSFLVVAGSSLISAAIHAQSGRYSRMFLVQLSFPCLLIALVTGWGSLRMIQIERADAGRPTIRVSVIQPGSRDDLLSKLQRLTLDVDQPTDLFIWGESSIDQFSLSLKSFAHETEVHAQHRFGESGRVPCPGLAAPLLCGGGSFAVGQHAGPFRNTAYLLDHDQNIIGRYHKRILMPWGEYALGQQWIPGLREMLTSAESLEPGYSATPLKGVQGQKLGVLICYEDLLPEPARESVQEGAEILINLNNLHSFRDTKALQTHQMLARFRTIECRRWLVRAGINGTSSIISATGATMQILPTDQPGTMTATVPLLDSESFYTQWGDVFAKTCAGLLIITSIWSLRSTKTDATK